MKKLFVLSAVVFSLLSAQEFSDDYIAHRFDHSDRKTDYGDSIRLPPRMRGFGDADYFESFIKPRQRDSLNVRCVGRWPFGPGFEVYGDTVNNLLCFGSGSGVLVFDISNPGNPTRLSQIAVNGLIMQVYMRDSLLFVSSYGNGIEVFNLVNPSNPAKVSQIDVPARDFCLKDTFAYCIAEDSLRIVNIANILSPYQVGACWDSSYTISISGNYVYTGGRWKLSAINVSNPSNPQVVNYLPVWVYTLTADGNHLYCVLNTGGFTIYNISNPSNIWQESQLSTVGGVDIYKLGYFVYLPGFVIVDVADSANPYVVGDTSLPVYAQAVWVNDNFGYAYVANDYVGLTPININNPTNPTALASVYGADDSRDVFVQGNYAYVSNSRKGLKIIDVADPSTPYEVGEYDTVSANPITQTSWVTDTLAYVPLFQRFKVLNVSIPSSPQLIGVCSTVQGGEDICIKDTLAYVIEGRIFQSIKINSPTVPESLPRYWLPDVATAWTLVVQDSLAYIADGDSGLRILNISNPAAPSEIGYVENPPGGSATGIFVEDTLAYLATWGGGLRILNVHNPSSPYEIGYHPSAAWDVVVRDSIAYVSSNLGYLNVINVANPVNPVLLGYYENPHYAYDVFIDSTLVYVVCHEAGVSILEWNDTGIEEGGGYKIVQCELDLTLTPTIARAVVNVSICASFEQNSDLTIYDESGREILSVLTGIIAKGGFKKQIDVSAVAAGVYFVVLKAGGRDLVKKVVIVH